MSTQASNLKVGLFVILGLVLGVGAVAWLGASQYLKGAKTYVTFFNESVLGLQNDSTVKYRGVDVGRVKAIRVAPDYRLIEVVMAVEFEGDLSKEMVAQLTSAGITGITFIELDRKKPGAAEESPGIDFVAEYPIIPSRPSELTRIVSTLDRVMSQFRDIDFKGMGQKVDQTLTSLQKLMGDQRLQRAMSQLEAATAATEKLAARLNLRLSDQTVQELVDNSRAAVAAGRGMLAELERELKAMKLAQTTARASQLFSDLEQRSRQMGAQAQQLALQAQSIGRNLEQASANLRDLMGRLQQNPSALIFSQPPPPRRERAATGK